MNCPCQLTLMEIRVSNRFSREILGVIEPLLFHESARPKTLDAGKKSDDCEAPFFTRCVSIGRSRD